MSEWPTVTLADIADIRFSNVDKKSLAGEKSVRLCNYMDAYANNYITADLPFMEATATAPEMERFKIEKGDNIITKDSETPDDIGIPAVVIDDIPNLICGYHLALIKPKHDKVDPIYLSKQLGSQQSAIYFSRIANGSTRYGLSSSAIASIKIPLAPFVEQRRIADVLFTLDKAIEKTEALITKYQQIKAGLMHDLFTRGVTADGKLRPPRAQAPELYHETVDGWIPTEWEAKTLGEACDWYSGGTPSKGNDSWWAGDLPWLSPKDMKQFELADTQDHVTRHAAMLASRIVPKESVFIVVRGMILAHSFPVVLSSTEFAFNQDVKAIIGRPPLGNRFLAYWLVDRTELFLRKTTEATHGTKRFDLEDLYGIVIGLPSIAEQLRIMSRLDVLEQRISSEAAQLDKLRKQKLGLMSDLLTGKVRVKFAAPPQKELA